MSNQEKMIILLFSLFYRSTYSVNIILSSKADFNFVSFSLWFTFFMPIWTLFISEIINTILYTEFRFKQLEIRKLL